MSRAEQFSVDQMAWPAGQWTGASDVLMGGREGEVEGVALEAGRKLSAAPLAGRLEPEVRLL